MRLARLPGSRSGNPRLYPESRPIIHPGKSEFLSITTSTRDNLIALFSGSGIGLLVGVLMGIAVSPTVGIVIGALASSLALMLGLNDQHFSHAKAFRIGSFGFVCVAGAFLGIFIRTHHLLAPSLQTQLNDYAKAGYTKEEALDFIKFTKFGILNPNWKIASMEAERDEGKGEGEQLGAGKPSHPIAPLPQLAATGVLYGAEIDASACTILKDKDEKNVSDQFYILGDVWERLATAVEQDFDERTTPGVLLTIRDGICGDDGAAKAKFEKCPTLANLNEQTGLPQIARSFEKAGPSWQRLVDAVQERIDQEHQSKVLLILQRKICHEEKQG